MSFQTTSEFAAQQIPCERSGDVFGGFGECELEEQEISQRISTIAHTTQTNNENSEA